MITVILPTVNRQPMLRTALQSVGRQRVKDQIGMVIGSENAVGRESENICTEFRELLINYVFGDPPLTALEHGVALFAEVKNSPSSYVANLHDDDWWGTNHPTSAFTELVAEQLCPAFRWPFLSQRARMVRRVAQPS